MSRRTCKICGSDVGSADFDTCGRHACQRAVRDPVFSGFPQPEAVEDLGELLVGIDEPDPPATPAPTANPDLSWLLLDRLSAAGERRHIVWLQGRISLLRRCAVEGREWARPQPIR
jgi:hypothetical protein